MKKELRLSVHANNNTPYRASSPMPVQPAPLLTIERAIADELCPASLRHVAAANSKLANGNPRLRRQADNLLRVAEKMELLGFWRKEAA